MVDIEVTRRECSASPRIFSANQRTLGKNDITKCSIEIEIKCNLATAWVAGRRRASGGSTVRRLRRLRRDGGGAERTATKAGYCFSPPNAALPLGCSPRHHNAH